MKLKKLLLVLVIMIGLFSLVGCEKKETKKDNKSTKTEEKTKKTGDSKIVGEWVYEDSNDFIYTFNEDGTGTYLVAGKEMNFTYTTSGNEISILYDGDTVSLDTEYSIKGDTLNIKDSFGDDTLYKRK